MQTKERIFVFLVIYFLLKAQISVCFKFQSISCQYEKGPNVTLQRLISLYLRLLLPQISTSSKCSLNQLYHLTVSSLRS